MRFRRLDVVIIKCKNAAFESNKYIFPNFWKVVDDNLSAFREATPSQGFYGLEKVESGAKVRRKEKRRERRGEKDYATFFVIILSTLEFLKDKTCTFRTSVSKKHDLSRVVFKNPGKYTSSELWK